MTTAYDRVAYPSAVFEQTHPERLAILARLVGLDPVPPTEARILEVGGGDCLNLLAMADVFPGCEAHGFDLSERAIAQGQSYVDGAGLANATLRVADILDAATIYPAGHFDYVIVHGVYAWVPDHVRANRLLNVPYTDEQLASAATDARAQAEPMGENAYDFQERYPDAVVRDFDGDPTRVTEMDALIAYLQMLGTGVDFETYQAEAPENQR